MLKILESIYARFTGMISADISNLNIQNNLLKMLFVYVTLIILSTIVSILLYVILKILYKTCFWIFIIIENIEYSLKNCNKLSYTNLQLVERKLKADIIFILQNGLNLCPTGADIALFLIFGYPDNIWEKVCFFSIESFISSIKSLLRYIVKINKMRLIFICYSIYYVYGEQIVKYLRTVKSNTFNVDDVMSIVSFIVVIYAGIYFWGDFRYKSNGFNEIKKQRYIQLLGFEEELLAIYKEIYCLLDKNIGELIKTRECIIREMIYDCYEVDCDTVKSDLEINDVDKFFIKSNYLGNKILEDFEEITEFTDKYKDLINRFLKSELKYADLFYVDKNAFINNIFVSWEFRGETHELTEEHILCKEKMTTWYNTRINKMKGKAKIVGKDKERIKAEVKELAMCIDWFLEDAIMLRNTLNSRIRRLNKRFAFQYQMSKYTPVK